MPWDQILGQASSDVEETPQLAAQPPADLVQHAADDTFLNLTPAAAPDDRAPKRARWASGVLGQPETPQLDQHPGAPQPEPMDADETPFPAGPAGSGDPAVPMEEDTATPMMTRIFPRHEEAAQTRDKR